MTETLTPYREVITCGLAVADEHGDRDCGHKGYCEYTRLCGTCGRDVAEAPCPEHAPLSIPGLQLIGCEEGHARTWVLTDDGYPPPCPWCVIDAEARAHEGCEHARHGRWRRWKVTHRALLDLYSLGVVAGYGSRIGGGCQGCATGIRFGRSGYLLGWPRWKWQCLLSARHWPGEEVLRGMCGKCAPWPCCGSTRLAHAGECKEAQP